VAVLYGGSAFYCRTCHGLTYRSQTETISDRCFRRANTLRKRLGGEPGVDQYVPRPKWMRWSTYDRLAGEIRALENSGFLAVAARFPELLQLVDRDCP
jgi:hypothetical protein